MDSSFKIAINKWRIARARTAFEFWLVGGGGQIFLRSKGQIKSDLMVIQTRYVMHSPE